MSETDFSNLSKKERKQIKREMERREKAEGAKQGNMIKWIVIGVLVAFVAGGGYLIYGKLTKPLPGTFSEAQGRDHVPQTEWSKFAFSTNPPTSGPHDPVWTNTGVYQQPQGDGHLVHSLEHGYIVISYNCNVEGEKGEGEREKVATESASASLLGGGEASKSGTLPSSLSSDDCDKLKKQLSDLADDKKLWKLVVVPRPNLDTRIALTAWTWLEKLDNFDKGKIVEFIDAHRNHGPEQTME